jgi:hypothetical protein
MKPDERGLVEMVKDIVDDVIDIPGRVERNPYGMMAGAMGVGFVLGGGLFTRITEKIAGAALRIGVMAALPHLEKEFGRYMGRDAESASPPSGKGE